MSALRVTLAAIVMFPCVLAHAQPRALPLYPESTIREWQPEFSQMVKENYEKVLFPQLTAAEAQRLRSLRWDFPLDPSLFALQFWAREDGTITLPVASLLFLKDIANADAWLALNGYPSQTVLDYLTILGRGRLGEWPARDRLPLAALGIPEKGLREPMVLERRNEILSKSILFVMGHELGHLVHGMRTGTPCDERRQGTGPPPGCDFSVLQNQEARADRFAVELFRRIGLVPSASNFIFVAFSRINRLRAEFPSDVEWQRYAAQQDHPLDAKRVHGVAAAIEAERSAFASMVRPQARAELDRRIEGLNDLARFLDDPDLSALQLAWAKTLAPQDIKPRRSIVPTLRPQAADLAATLPFTGYFRGEMRPATSSDGQPLEILFRASSAELMLMGIRGRLDGTVDTTNRAIGTLDIGGDIYDVQLEARDANSVAGVYQSRAQPSASGQLRLNRSRTAP
jgi:hypothetical protein